MDYKKMKPIGLVRLMLTDGVITREQAAKYFPELAESEDEKTRKWIYRIIEYLGFPADEDAEKELVKMQPLALAWLEKQGEKKPAKDKGMNLDEESMTPFQKEVFCIIDTAVEEEQGLKKVCDELLALASNEFEKNRLAACDAQTNEEAEIERDFVMSIIENEHRQPTFDDAIKYGMKLQKNQMMEKAVTTTFNASLPCSVYDKLKAKGCKEGDKLLIIIKED